MRHEGHIESIRQRLLNLSRESGETFDYVLARYGIERVLYRLGKSELADQFVLKGATLFHVWNRKLHRPTRDLDLLGFGPNDPETLRGVMLAGGEDDRRSLDTAIRATFQRRGSVLPTEPPTGLSDEFAHERHDMWNAFLRKNGLKADEFIHVVQRIRAVLQWIWKA